MLDFLAYFLIFLFAFGIGVAGFFYFKTENKVPVAAGLVCSSGALVFFAGMYAHFSYWWWLIPLAGILYFYWAQAYNTFVLILSILVILFFAGITAHRIWNFEVPVVSKNLFPQSVPQQKPQEPQEGPLFEMMRQADRKMKDLEEENQRLKDENQTLQNTLETLRKAQEQLQQEIKNKDAEIKAKEVQIEELTKKTAPTPPATAP